MKFKALGLMKSSPGFTMENHLNPLDFSAHIKGTMQAEVGTIEVAITEIPVSMRIPFLKGRRHLVTIGSIGGMKVSIDPVTLSLNEIGVSLEGMLGQKGEGITMHTDAKVACRTEMEVMGEVCGKVGMGSIDLGECNFEVTRPTDQSPKAGPEKK